AKSGSAGRIARPTHNCHVVKRYYSNMLKPILWGIGLAGSALFVYGYATRPLWFTTAQVGVLWATGNARGCTFAGSFDLLSTRIKRQEEQVKRESRQLPPTSEGFEHWQTPLGEFYDHGSNVTFLVAEQMAGAYDV